MKQDSKLDEIDIETLNLRLKVTNHSIIINHSCKFHINSKIERLKDN